MFLKLARLYVRMRDRVKKLPKPISLAISYVLLYFTGVKEVTDLLESGLKISDSVLEMIRRGALVVLASHWLLVTVALTLATWRKRRYKSMRALLAATLLAALGIGALATVPTIVLRGPTKIVDDKARTALATQTVPEFEADISNGLKEIFGRAYGRLQSFREKLQDEEDNHHDLRAFFIHEYQKKGRVSNQTYGYLLVYQPPGLSANVEPLAAPDFATEVPEQLVEHLPGIRTCSDQGGASITQWLTWTRFGHLAVAACQDPKLGTLIAATLWDERSFLASTRGLWDGKGFGLSLIQSGNQITYTTEISDYGDRRRNEPAEALEKGRVTEVHYRKHVSYVYQALAHDHDQFPDLSFRLRFPDTPRPTLRQIMISILVLILGLGIVAVIIVEQVIVDADERLAEVSPQARVAP